MTDTAVETSPKYKDADKNSEAISLLPEIVTFLAEIAKADLEAENDTQAAASLTRLADQAENLKFKMGYGY